MTVHAFWRAGRGTAIRCTRPEQCRFASLSGA